MGLARLPYWRIASKERCDQDLRNHEYALWRDEVVDSLSVVAAAALRLSSRGVGFHSYTEPHLATDNGLGKLAERVHWSEASSNIRAVWHSDELVVWNRPIAPGVHGSSAHLAVPRMPIAGRGLAIGDFIQRPTMGALEGLSHPPSIGAIVLCIHPARARIRHRF